MKKRFESRRSSESKRKENRETSTEKEEEPQAEAEVANTDKRRENEKDILGRTQDPGAREENVTEKETGEKRNAIVKKKEKRTRSAREIVETEIEEEEILEVLAIEMIGIKTSIVQGMTNLIPKIDTKREVQVMIRNILKEKKLKSQGMTRDKEIRVGTSQLKASSYRDQMLLLDKTIDKPSNTEEVLLQNLSKGKLTKDRLEKNHLSQQNTET